MKKNRVLLMALCGLCLHHNTVLADDQQENTMYDLGEIVVSGKADGVQAAETVYTVTAADIGKMNARTLDQAISLLPGVNIRMGAEGVPRIDVRGFRTRHVLLLLDGIPMNSAIDGQFDPTIISTENIAMIKMTTGASSVLYGQGGLGGVINIITQKGAKDFSGMLSAETGDHQPYLGRASVSGKKDKFDFFISGSSTRVNNSPLSDDFNHTSVQLGDYRENSDKERHNVLGTIGFTPNNDLSLGFTFNYTQGQYGKPPGTINNTSDSFASTPKYERIENYEGLSLQLAGNYQITNHFSLRGWTYLNQLHQQDNQYDDAKYNTFNKKNSFREKIESTVQGIALQPKYDLGDKGTITLSLINEWDRWKNSGQLTAANNQPLRQGANFARDISIHTIAAEYEVSPIKGLGLVAGYGHHWQLRDNTKDNDFSINAGVHYDILADTRLKFSFNRNVRFPSLDDLYNPNQGNAFLNTERSYTYEGGIEQKLPYNSTVSVTGFHTIAKNLIQNVAITSTTSQYRNLAEVEYNGFEIAAATQFLKNLLVRTSYTYLDSKDKSRTGRDQLQYTPRDRVTFETNYDFDCGFTPYVSVQYVGNQYFYTKDNAPTVQKQRLNDYVLVNVKLSQKLFSNKFMAYFGVNNIFDENYETSYGFPQAGRFIYGGIEFKI